MPLRARTNGGTPLRRRLLAMALAAVAASAVLVGLAPATPADALSGSEFNPELIMSDDLFYDSAAMSSAQIQAFLDSKIGTCENGRCLNVATVPFDSRPAYFSTRTGRLECSAVSGGNLRVSELIYRVQVACGISAKVILVTLQKEQGLITNRAPGDWALRAAMGMGCPDTAPCSDAFAGLANQIFSGTRQLKVYKAAEFARQPGLNFIGYHPNSSCGGTTLNIRNYATAALYNYTPYQPNAAALANLGATGDSCSSYGNRNFWYFHNLWFGPTTEPPCIINPTREITSYWNDLGGASSVLGAAVSPGIVPGPVGSTVGYFTNGAIYCTPRLGATAVVGAIQVKYEAMGGPASTLGSPMLPQTSLTAGGISGAIQEFQRGAMLSSTATGAYGVLYGPVRDAWGARGGSGGSLGWPTGDQQTVSGGVRQQFQRGLLALPTGRAAVVMTPEIATYWTTGSNTSLLGSPTGASSPLTAGGVTGTLQYFVKGMVLSSTTTGTYAVLDGPMRAAWGSQGGSGGSFGWPTGDQQMVGGGLRQDFQRGQIFAPASGGGGGGMSGDIATYWATGTNGSQLGYPTASPTSWTAGGLTGTLQTFERGMVLSSASTGTHAVFDGPIRDAWGRSGGSGGTFGWPTGEQTFSAGVSQDFQHGTITLTTGLTGAIGTYWWTGTNGTRLGSPTSAPATLTAGGVTGTIQYFQRGMVLSSSTTGTFGVFDGPARNAWGSQGGSNGALGWPIGDMTTTSGVSRQEFQRGSVFVPYGGTGVVLLGDMATYWSSNGNAARLGAPTSSPTALTAGGITGAVQYFQRGLVLSSTTTGIHAVLDGPYRNAWGSQGGSGGSLGWPIGETESVSGGTRQQFQRGVIMVPANGVAVVLSGEIGTYWATGSNASRLGPPSASPMALTAGGVSGFYQVFERGMVLSSTTTGTFAVFNGPIRTAWGSAGGSGGSLGWPIAGQEAISDGIRQQFQNGTITITGEGQPITLTGEYSRYWSTGTNGTTLGLPLTNSPVTWTAGGVSGSYQVFARGMVMSSTTTGTFAVLDGPIRNVWGSQGGSGGILGWPIADQAPSPEGVTQPFQHGSVIVPTSGTAYYVMN